MGFSSAETGSSNDVLAADVAELMVSLSLRADPRVTSLEGTDARALDGASLPRAPSLVAIDVSFISLRLALPPALDLAAEGAFLVALIKPQFEAGREAVGRGGMVSDPAVHEQVCADAVSMLRLHGWTVLGVTPSPVEGGDGNREFLVGARKG